MEICRDCDYEFYNGECLNGLCPSCRNKKIQQLEQRIANAIDVINRVPEDVLDPHNWFHAIKLELEEK